MTPASRSGAPARRPRAVNRILAWGIIAWYGGCIILGNLGCFVTWPFPLIIENEPPELDASGDEPGDLVSIDSEGQLAWVLANDPDANGTLLFVWQLGSELLIDEPQRIEVDNDDGELDVYWRDTVVLPYDVDHHDERLRVEIIDPDGGNLELSWPVEVL
ncbi:MAG: hypothetical protein EXR71_02175 [Myxococcales bacterium]|nr:hypothetical protein [Myxococcales bacterium]